jgi:predicted dehydrogenase
MLNFGIVGYGYWGPNIVRNLSTIGKARVHSVCDINTEACHKVKMMYPHVNVTDDFKSLIKSPDIDVISVITPVSTHYELAKKALEAGKHVFVEKPFTESVEQAERLIALANKKKLKIMVDHTFLFTGAVRKIKELLDQNALGNLYYYDSSHVSLGLFQHDVNVIWDLAPHDFSIIDYLIKNKPLAVTAHGVDHMKRGQENVAYIIVYFENNFMAHININWLSPVKIRTTCISGEKKMLVWDDLQADEKIKIYDRGVETKSKEGIYRLLVDYRAGDMHSPHLEPKEALRSELEYFVDCIMNNQTPINDGEAGLRIVKMLQATDESLRKEGKKIKL